MSAMLVQKDARVIAKKLQAEVSEGRRHHIVVFRYGGKHIAQFGIQRGSKDQSHNYIAKQLFLSQKQCREFLQCSLSRDAYIALLKSRGDLG